VTQQAVFALGESILYQPPIKLSAAALHLPAMFAPAAVYVVNGQKLESVLSAALTFPAVSFYDQSAKFADMA
jgi:hypothetical protein